MKKANVLAILVYLLVVANIALVDSVRGINIDFVTIGNAGNAADTGGIPGCGAVAYNYRIGKYEVINAQWNAFIAAAGTPTGNEFGYTRGVNFTGIQQPTNNVSWLEASQFCNYLTSGDKSKGVYQFSGNNANPGIFLGTNRAAAQAIYGTIYVIPTEDEWYKAAYFKPDGSGYSLYANGTNVVPVAGVDTNYNYAIGSPWNINNGTVEQNGTYDMMGNVFEWNETPFGSRFGIRGGSYVNTEDGLGSSGRNQGYPGIELISVGFRVASIPEPATLLLLGLGGLVLRRKYFVR
jgi:formylglycine-generating enzyme required for sulfatase activity